MVLVFGVILFVVMLLMGVPIAYGMLSTTLFGMAFLPNVELITVTQRMLSGLNSFTLLAVPMFIMAANLMNIGNISQQLVNFCVAKSKTCVPTISDGMRSGVHWMRLNVPDTEVARVCAAVVLARPGTDSIRMWPPATMVRIRDSRRCS